jgi:conserved hypothetical protein YmdA/YtgF
MPHVLTIVLVIVGVLIGILIGYILRKTLGEKAIGSAEQKARNLVLDAENKSETIKKEIELQAKEAALQFKNEAEEEINQRRNELTKSEDRLVQKEESIDKKLENIERKEQSITSKEQNINNKLKDLDDLHQRQVAKLEEMSGMTRDEAKQILLDSIEGDVRADASAMIRDIEGRAKDEADKYAKQIIVGAIQRCAADNVAESTVSVVNLPNDEMKGRIIGREGRNIRAIESLTGIELIIDDTPEAVILSGFDPIRREIARLTLEKLIVDGRIHPARIEETVKKSEKEVNASIKEAGETASFDVGIHNLHPELIKLLGRLKYRTSYGQNVLQHSEEVAYLAGLMAGELGLDVKLAKRAGLLHDIGKSIDHDHEGTHVDLGMEVLKRYKESQPVIDAMASHHGDYEPKSMEAVLVAAADALSAARPGARRETLESYIKRLDQLEQIANDMDGVDKSFAIQAGREIRVMVKPDKIKDDEMPYLARQISKKVEEELDYPGQIKVNIMRETRAVDYAK